MPQCRSLSLALSYCAFLLIWGDQSSFFAVSFLPLDFYPLSWCLLNVARMVQFYSMILIQVHHHWHNLISLRARVCNREERLSYKWARHHVRERRIAWIPRCGSLLQLHSSQYTHVSDVECLTFEPLLERHGYLPDSVVPQTEQVEDSPPLALVGDDHSLKAIWKLFWPRNE